MYKIHTTKNIYIIIMYRIAATGFGLGLTVVGAYKVKSILNQSSCLELAAQSIDTESTRPYAIPLPSRNTLLTSLQDEKEVFDILVIGGGATGTGVALDAAKRGLKTALVEKYDYSSGTSSKSTKLVHGGVRYLQNAILKLDREQYGLVKEALFERANVLNSAPHIATPLPIMLPVYKWWQVPYFWVGIKAYDLVAGRQLVKKSYFVGKRKTLEMFPMLKDENLCGSIIYYDGQQNDSRMNLSLAMSAVRNGAKCVNHVEVVNLLFDSKKKDEPAKVNGARMRDMFTGDEWDVKAKCVVNATGPFTDSIRKMSNDNTAKICQPAAGTHIVLPDYYCSKDVGLLDPATSDGRVVFVLPWEGYTIAGTTDHKCDVTFNPESTEQEILFILDQIKKYIRPDIEVRREDVLAAWSGLRPLVSDPSSKDTKSISRNHVIEVNENQLVTIAGGKWTTYRSMSQDTVDAAIKQCNLQPKDACSTSGYLVEGAENWHSSHYISLVQKYGIETEVAQHLSHTYGSKSDEVLELAKPSGKRWPLVGERLIQELPFLKSEVLYSVRNEYACTVIDVIARRIRLAFLNVYAAKDVIPSVIQIMSEELEWDETRKQKEHTDTIEFLKTMGLPKDQN